MLNPIDATPRAISRATTLATVTTAAGAVNTNSSGVRIPEWEHGVVFTLDVTAAATDAGDTLDVTVQSLVDGTNWLDILHFTQILGNGGALRFSRKILASSAEATDINHATALAAGDERHFLGDAYRVKYVQADVNVNAAFTFSVSALAM